MLNVAHNPTYRVEIIEPVIEFVRTELGFQLKQVVPMLWSSKPGKDRERVGWGRKAEPILVFSKGCFLFDCEFIERPQPLRHTDRAEGTASGSAGETNATLAPRIDRMSSPAVGRTSVCLKHA